MSILIKGMEMPKDGAFVEVLIWSDGHITQTGDSYIAEDGRMYYQPCDWKYFSAVTVPPHGRLIDADNLLSVLDILCDKGGDIRYWEQLAWIIKDCPTIIEAEEEESV